MLAQIHTEMLLPGIPRTVLGETREHLDQGLCDARSVLTDPQRDMWTPFILGLRVRVRLGSGTWGRVVSLHRTDRSHFSGHQSCRCSCALTGLVTTRAGYLSSSPADTTNYQPLPTVL